MSLGVVASDVNNDGYTDIFVSNDFNAPDFLFINNQDGTFTNQINTSLQQTSFFGMGADIADFNNDGFMDIFQLDMSANDNFRSKANMSSMDPASFYKSVALGLHHQNMQNSLQMNNGNRMGELPVFSNVSRLAGVSSTDWSWGDYSQILTMTDGKTYSLLMVSAAMSIIKIFMQDIAIFLTP